MLNLNSLVNYCIRWTIQSGNGLSAWHTFKNIYPTCLFYNNVIFCVSIIITFVILWLSTGDMFFGRKLDLDGNSFVFVCCKTVFFYNRFSCIMINAIIIIIIEFKFNISITMTHSKPTVRTEWYPLYRLFK